MFFILRSHHDDIIREKNLQIGYRDHRIAELDAERKLLWDKLCLLEIGEGVFNTEGPQPPGSQTRAAFSCGGVEVPSAAHDKTTAVEQGSCGTVAPGGGSQSTKSQPLQDAASALKNGACFESHPEPGASCSVKDPDLPSKSPRLGSPRPSQIMRQMDRLMHTRWLQKLRPAKAAEKKRDEVMSQLDKAHKDAVRTGRDNNLKLG